MIQYRLYRNDGAGGPVNLAAPVATVAGLTFLTDSLAPGDWSFLVRAYDDVTRIEDRNVTARTRLVVGPAGENLTGRPLAPVTASAQYRTPGLLLVRWHHADAVGIKATMFLLWVAAVGPIDFTSPPVLTVPVRPGQADYSASIPVQSLGPWVVGLAAQNQVGPDGTGLTLAVPSVQIPRGVDSLQAGS